MGDKMEIIPTCGICGKVVNHDSREGMVRETWYGLDLVHENCGRKELAYDRHDRKRAEAVMQAIGRGP